MVAVGMGTAVGFAVAVAMGIGTTVGFAFAKLKGEHAAVKAKATSKMTGPNRFIFSSLLD